MIYLAALILRVLERLVLPFLSNRYKMGYCSADRERGGSSGGLLEPCTQVNRLTDLQNNVIPCEGTHVYIIYILLITEGRPLSQFFRFHLQCNLCAGDLAAELQLSTVRSFHG